MKESLEVLSLMQVRRFCHCSLRWRNQNQPSSGVRLNSRSTHEEFLVELEPGWRERDISLKLNLFFGSSLNVKFNPPIASKYSSLFRWWSCRSPFTWSISLSNLPSYSNLCVALFSWLTFVFWRNFLFAGPPDFWKLPGFTLNRRNPPPP